ncbi:MAG: pyrroline-5-carboxylate reductase [Coriobacteriia bacterium]|nr:pyrroline-5-carboxylate reductase [Coriobacteriia bacterium]
MTEDSLHYDGTLAVIGGGRMGEAIVGGLVRSGAVPAASITVAEPSLERRDALSAAFGVHCVADGAEALPSDTVILAVKPQVIDAVAAALSSKLAGSLIVSIAVGITCARLEAALPSGTPVVRVMPNTPALVGEGMSVVSGGTEATAAQTEIVRALFASLGRSIVLEERYQDAAAAISGSGPAYFALVVDALARGGVRQGLARDVAQALAIQTMLGTAKLLDTTGMHPEALVDGVTSPGGTTIAAVEALEARAVRSAFAEAVAAAVHRSKELGS